MTPHIEFLQWEKLPTAVRNHHCSYDKSSEDLEDQSVIRKIKLFKVFSVKIKLHRLITVRRPIDYNNLIHLKLIT